MREILFRAKRLDNGKWAESTSIVRNELEEGEKYYIGARQPALQGVDEHGNIMDVETLGECLFYACDPETIGQYTGLKDRNGKKIFEGDIVKHWIGSFGSETLCDTGRVYWDANFCGWRRTTDGIFHSQIVDTYKMSPECDYEAIGNIHDNPELLEED